MYRTVNDPLTAPCAYLNFKIQGGRLLKIFS